MSSQLPPPVLRAPSQTASAGEVAVVVRQLCLGSCSGFIRSFHSAGRASGFGDSKSTGAH